MPARGPLRPGAEERKTEIETAGGRGKIWADRVGGSKDRGTRESGQEAPSPSDPAALIYLSHHDSWLLRAAHKPGTAHKPSLVHRQWAGKGAPVTLSTIKT